MPISSDLKSRGLRLIAASVIVGAILVGLWQGGVIFQTATDDVDGSVRAADASIETPNTTGAEVGVRPGNIAPNFEASTLGGERFRLADFRGRPVFINFWATWCGPCRVELPDIQATSQRFADQGLVVITVNNGETAKAARRYLDDLDLDFGVRALDPGSDVTRRYRAEGMPTSIFIDANGFVTRFHAGQLSINVMESAVREAIAGASNLRGAQ
jgi:thiol-disulfide isomerase/thioredoxin